MLDRDLKNHAGEFRRYLATGQYDKTDTGLYFPKAKATVSGLYIHDVNGQDERQDPNLVVDEGLMYMLSASFDAGTPITAWYLSLYAANYTVLAGLNAGNYPATASEITSLTEGFSQATRPLWVRSAPAANIIDNVASKAVFTIVTASSLTVNGAALHSIATRGAVTGTLASATKFSATRTLYNTDSFNLAYRVSLTSS